MNSISINQGTTVDIARPRYAGWLIWLFCAYLLFVGVAELLIAQIDPRIGLMVHALLLLTLTLHAGLGRDASGRKLALALTLAPLLRILSLALPLANLPQLAWYPVVSVPLLISAGLIIRQLRMSRSELGLRPDNPLFQLMIMGGGLGVGAVEYALLGSSQLVVAFSWNALTLLAVVLLVFTGFVEELIFRGLLQSAALSALGRWSLIYVSLLFAALQLGYLSAPVVAFAFGIGLIFAYAARLSGSIVGVALAHGLANITLFILMPFLARQLPSLTTMIVRSAIATGTTLAVVAMAILIVRAVWQARATSPTPVGEPAMHAVTSSASVAPTLAAQNQLPKPATIFMHMASGPRPAVDLVPAVPIIRALRRNAGMTYSEMAQRTQLPVRLLAEIEHGLRRPEGDQLSQIFQALGVDLRQSTVAAV